MSVLVDEIPADETVEIHGGGQGIDHYTANNSDDVGCYVHPGGTLRADSLTIVGTDPTEPEEPRHPSIFLARGRTTLDLSHAAIDKDGIVADGGAYLVKLTDVDINGINGCIGAKDYAQEGFPNRIGVLTWIRGRASASNGHCLYLAKGVNAYLNGVVFEFTGANQYALAVEGDQSAVVGTQHLVNAVFKAGVAKGVIAHSSGLLRLTAANFQVGENNFGVVVRGRNILDGACVLEGIAGSFLISGAVNSDGGIVMNGGELAGRATCCVYRPEAGTLPWIFRDVVIRHENNIDDYSSVVIANAPSEWYRVRWENGPTTSGATQHAFITGNRHVFKECYVGGVRSLMFSNTVAPVVVDLENTVFNASDNGGLYVRADYGSHPITFRGSGNRWLAGGPYVIDPNHLVRGEMQLGRGTMQLDHSTNHSPDISPSHDTYLLSGGILDGLYMGGSNGIALFAGPVTLVAREDVTLTGDGNFAFEGDLLKGQSIKIWRDWRDGKFYRLS